LHGFENGFRPIGASFITACVNARLSGRPTKNQRQFWQSLSGRILKKKTAKPAPVEREVPPWSGFLWQD
jgi:hypothetical protein